MSCIDVSDMTGWQIQFRHEQRNETIRRSVVGEVLVDRVNRLRDVPSRGDLSVYCGVQARHQKRRSRPFSGDVAQRDHHPAVWPPDEVVIITTDFITRKRNSLELISFDRWRGGGLETLLDLRCELQFGFHPLALKPL